MLYMKTLIIILLSITSTIVAQLPSKLDDLKAKKEAAIKRIEDTYKVELEKLLNDPMVKADQQLQMAIRDELGLPQIKKIVADPEWFVGLNWLTGSGSKFTFTKTGRVIQQHNKNLYNFKWKFVKDQIVKVTGDFRDSSNSTERYFEFSPDGTARYGASADNMIPIDHE